jgi:hypothetical protein
MVNQRKESAAAFLALRRILASSAPRIERVMTDNGSCRRSRTCQQLAISVSARIFTKQYTPTTNGA